MIWLKDTYVLPTLVTVTVWGGLELPTETVPKFRLEGESRMAVPTPVRETVWGLLAALSVMVTVPVRVLGAVGVKVTPMTQLLPALTVVPQVLV